VSQRPRVGSAFPQEKCPDDRLAIKKTHGARNRFWATLIIYNAGPPQRALPGPLPGPPERIPTINRPTSTLVWIIEHKFSGIPACGEKKSKRAEPRCLYSFNFVKRPRAVHPHKTQTTTPRNRPPSAFIESPSKMGYPAPLTPIGVAPERTEKTGARTPVTRDATPKLLNRLAVIFVCSLCTRFDIFLSILAMKSFNFSGVGSPSSSLLTAPVVRVGSFKKTIRRITQATCNL